MGTCTFNWSSGNVFCCFIFKMLNFSLVFGVNSTLISEYTEFSAQEAVSVEKSDKYGSIWENW